MERERQREKPTSHPPPHSLRSCCFLFAVTRKIGYLQRIFISMNNNFTAGFSVRCGCVGVGVGVSGV